MAEDEPEEIDIPTRDHWGHVVERRIQHPPTDIFEERPREDVFRRRPATAREIQEHLNNLHDALRK